MNEFFRNKLVILMNIFNRFFKMSLELKKWMLQKRVYPKVDKLFIFYSLFNANDCDKS